MARRTKQPNSGPSQRQLRVGEELRHHLSALPDAVMFIAELDSVPITVTEVSVSPDLANAHVFVMSLGGADIDRVLPALNRAAPHLQHNIAAKVHLRRMPRLKFSADTGFDTAEHMASLFAKLTPGLVLPINE